MLREAIVRGAEEWSEKLFVSEVCSFRMSMRFMDDAVERSGQIWTLDLDARQQDGLTRRITLSEGV